MASIIIDRFSTHDVRFPLNPGEGSDAVHSNPQYSFAVTRLYSEGGLAATGITLTLGSGNELVCAAINHLAPPLVGQEIEELMGEFGKRFRMLADHHHLRWLGPHKGVIHLALASIVNACFDLWAKSRGVPLWRLLLDLSPADIVNLIDLSYVEDVLSSAEALAILNSAKPSRSLREPILKSGYPGYDTSVGWFEYDDQKIRENARRAMNQGFRAFKLKVGAANASDDVRRANILRETVGSEARIMLDANQQWEMPQAIEVCRELAGIMPHWIEEPTHPDDIFGHQMLAKEIAPIPLALGEHVPNRVVFKNYLQSRCVGFLQVDCTRVGGVSEFITISLLARKFGIPVLPHVGDMGQIHQHLVIFNHIALDHPVEFLEHIPHLRKWFLYPARVRGGVYETPEESGSSSDLCPSGDSQTVGSLD